ncbi:hypothetical protein HYDPIDRAFT_28156 [Hydnomerulius pinastri MD-312]|uniref:DUF6534 domain-containing protein n=1 Tax=Hydnomerulius pinastri MD-312 TaxID=994086 RepID=A0A0C9W1L7_9AGAM|nr:hypothetical protein HYDPIDRAFT_28156 [Hydnomerulius pinastri MD-312]
MSAIEFTGINLGSEYGPILAGIFITLVFYGISIMQTFLYYLQYPEDKVHLKLLVVIVFLLDTLHKFLACAGIWNYLVQYYGDFINLEDSHPPIFLASLVTSLLSFITQSFFVYRIWSLNKTRFKWVVPAALMPFITAQPVICSYYVAKALVASNADAVRGDLLKTVANASNGIAAAVDVVIAIAMCILLAMGRTGFNQNTDRMLLRLMFISINTGLWTAVVAVLAVILLVALPSEEVYSVAILPLGTLYCNTLLASLNVRSYVRGDDSYEVYNIKPGGSPEGSRSGGSAAPVVNHLPINVTMKTSKIIQSASSDESMIFSRSQSTV